MVKHPIAPMKATLGRLPTDESGWAFEIKWDGHRTLAHIDIDTEPAVWLQSTAGHDVTARWPEVTSIVDAINARSAVLDGEMTVLGEDGWPSFDLVQRRDVGRHPAVFQIFDVLEIDGTPTIELPYEDRRRLLEHLVEEGDNWKVPVHRVGDGKALVDATDELGLEGVIAKRLGSHYRPGKRSNDWIKIKHRREVELVVGGFTTGTGGRTSTFGALLVGVEEEEPAGTRRLRFAGGVGTGFDVATLDALQSRLDPLRTDDCPFEPTPPAAVHRTATWVRPELRVVAEIAEFTNDGHVRQASFVRAL